MQYIVENKIDILYELMNTFYFISNEKELNSSLEKMLIREGINKDEYLNKNLKNFFGFIKKFKELNSISIEKINMYFKKIYSYEISNYSIAFLLFQNLNIEELNEFKEKIIKINNEDLQESFLKDILIKLEKLDEEDTLNYINNYDLFINYLTNNKDLTNESKWWLTIIFHEPKKYLLELIDIILISINNFKIAFKILQKDTLKFIKQLNEWSLRDKNFIESLTGFKVKCSDNVYIYPSMINFRSVHCMEDVRTLVKRKNKETIYFGWKFKELLDNNEIIKREEKILKEKLKCLSDKSKFEILKLLKNKPLYGQEIAHKLSLTPATVSYHMNNL
ncbi:winged helix-turn-helix domain-containing protein, partial [Clostridium tarantellae]